MQHRNDWLISSKTKFENKSVVVIVRNKEFGMWKDTIIKQNVVAKLVAERHRRSSHTTDAYQNKSRVTKLRTS